MRQVRLAPLTLQATKDRKIRNLIASQEDFGFQSVTDGEFRRSYWHFDFLEQLCGVEEGQTVHYDHPVPGHFRFVWRLTNLAAKMTLPSLSVLHVRAGLAAFSTEAYSEKKEFFHDLGETHRKAF